MLRAFTFTLLTAAALAAEDDPLLKKVALKDGDRIIFFGDSLTELAGKEEPKEHVTRGYVRIVREALNAAHPDRKIEVEWVATGGHTVPDLLKRVDRDVIARKPAIVFIQIGVNDANRGFTAEQFKAGLEELIEKLRKAGAQVVLCSLTSLGEKHDGTNRIDAKLDEFASVARGVAREQKVPLNDLRQAFLDYWKKNNPENKPSGLLTYDGNHFNDAGHRFVAEEMLKKLDAPKARDPWRMIEQSFRPPAEYAGKLGDYPSPLRFKDGSPVENAAAWSRRREEIRRDWEDLMGPWPPVIERPKLEVLSEAPREGFRQARVRLEVAPGQTGEGWLLIPGGEGPFPAVLVVYYEPETSVGLKPDQPLRDFGLQLARRGFVTLSIGTPGGDSRRPEQGAASCQPLSFHAYVAANCWHALAGRREVDRDRIGVVGHSYGGKWAMFAAALWDRFACVAVSDPGIVFDETRPNVNYWEPWYLGRDPERARKPGVPAADNPRTGAYRRMREAGRDLHELHALIAPRPFLVSGGSEDTPSRWVALNHAIQVNRLLGFSDRVAMTNRKDHTPTEESNAQLYAFFEHFLGKR